GNPVAYKWDFGVDGIESDTSVSVAPSYIFPGPGQYTVKLSAINSSGCMNTTSRLIYILDEVIDSLVKDSMVCYGEKVMLGRNDTDPLINYTWSPATSLDNPAIPNPTATVVQDQTYTVTRSSPTCYVQDNV